MITSLKEIKRTREKVMRRQAILLDALEEYNKAVDTALEEARAQAESRPLKVKEMAELLEVSPMTAWRWGVNELDTYAELWEWVRENRPQKKSTLEKNYKKTALTA